MSDAYTHYQQGRQHLRQGRPAQATVALENARRAEPDKASIREALGIAYFRIHRFAEAEREFRVVLDIAPTDHYAHFALGRCLERQGAAQEASRYYKLACCLRPGQPDYECARRVLAEGK